VGVDFEAMRVVMLRRDVRLVVVALWSGDGVDLRSCRWIHGWMLGRLGTNAEDGGWRILIAYLGFRVIVILLKGLYTGLGSSTDVPGHFNCDVEAG